MTRKYEKWKLFQSQITGLNKCHLYSYCQTNKTIRAVLNSFLFPRKTKSFILVIPESGISIKPKVNRSKSQLVNKSNLRKNLLLKLEKIRKQRRPIKLLLRLIFSQPIRTNGSSKKLKVKFLFPDKISRLWCFLTVTCWCMEAKISKTKKF